MAQNQLAALLRDFAQGASNSAASTVSAPVDGIAWLLRKAGVPIPAEPVGGSDWMARQGLTAQPTNALAGAVGEFAGGVAPIVAAAKAPQIANRLLQMQANAAAPSTLRNASQRGAIVYHGSPHKFDRFDSSKIGTGEGAQAYGHGLYLAESPDVARGYQTKLAGGAIVDSRGVPADATATTAELQKKLRAAGLGWDEAERAASGWSSAVFNGKTAELHPIVQQEIAAMGLAPKMQGSLYKVDLPDEQIARMLDWDKPLSQQAPEVREAAQRIAANLDPAARKLLGDSLPSLKGSKLYELIASDDSVAGAGQFGAAASDALRKAGVPGIRYLDGGSRGAGQGTSNFVAFPGTENMLTILERNGRPVR